MDLSESVVRARAAFTPDRANLHYIQGDILNPPLRPGPLTWSWPIRCCTTHPTDRAFPRWPSW